MILSDRDIKKQDVYIAPEGLTSPRYNNIEFTIPLVVNKDGKIRFYTISESHMYPLKLEYETIIKTEK